MIESIEVNLLPAEYRVHTRKIFLERVVLYPLVFAIFVFMGLSVWTVQLTAKIAFHKDKIVKIDREIEKNKHVRDEINALKEQKSLVQRKIRALERIDVNREKWIRLQEVFCQKLPEATWVERIDESGDSLATTLSLDGKTYAFPEVAVYMSRLGESEFVKSVNLVSIEQVDAREGIFKFSLECTIDPDARLAKVE